MWVQNAPQGPNSRRVCHHGKYDRRYRQDFVCIQHYEPSNVAFCQITLAHVLDEVVSFCLMSVCAAVFAAKLNGIGSSVSGGVTSSARTGREDPHYKHRCRYCQKGFTSDSALQIHIRSHTGLYSKLQVQSQQEVKLSLLPHSRLYTKYRGSPNIQ